MVDKSFVSEEFLARESDVIYKINLKTRQVYIFILLEFQSTVDKTIPVRMFSYLFQFYDLLQRDSQKGKLPSIFPLLLYSGLEDWTIPTNIKDLIDHQIPEKYIPNFEYYTIIHEILVFLAKIFVQGKLNYLDISSQEPVGRSRKNRLPYSYTKNLLNSDS